MFQNKVPFITHFPSPRKSCRLWNKVKKYVGAGDVTGYNILRNMRSACWIQIDTQNV